MGRIALPLARTEFFRSLRLRPPFHNVLNFPYAPQSRLQHRLSELEKPFKAPQSKLPCAPVDAQGVGSVGRDYFKLLPAIHTTSDTGSPTRAMPARGETGEL